MAEDAHDEQRVDVPTALLRSITSCKDPTHRFFRILTLSVVCSRTHFEAGPAVAAELLQRWPTPDDLAVADRAEVADVVAVVGLTTSRVTRLQAMAATLALDEQAGVAAARQLGSFAVQALELLSVDLPDEEPTDGRLAQLWRWGMGLARATPARMQARDVAVTALGSGPIAALARGPNERMIRRAAAILREEKRGDVGDALLKAAGLFKRPGVKPPAPGDERVVAVSGHRGGAWIRVPVSHMGLAAGGTARLKFGARHVQVVR